MKKEHLLIFGTSADPIHTGHVQLITDAVRALEKRDIRVREIMMMPVFRHHNIRDAIKRSLPLTFQHRFEICELAATELSEKLSCQVSVSSFERHLVETKNRLISLQKQWKRRPSLTQIFLDFDRRRFSGAEPGFQHWYRWQDL